MNLELADLMLLDKAEAGQKLTGSVSGGSYERLAEHGFIDERRFLTGKGAKFLGSLRKAVVEQQRGIAFARRKRNEADQAALPRSTPIGWFTGTYAKKQWIANGAAFIVGKPGKTMDSQAGDSEIRHKVATILQTGTAGKPEDFVDVEPYAFQVVGLGGIEMVWLKSADGTIIGAVQAMFFDLIKERYPTATFCAHRERFMSGALENQMFAAKVTNRGVKNNIVALVMALGGGARPELVEEQSGELSGD